MKRILLSIPHMGGGEEAYVREAFASNWLSSVGPNISAFEQEFASRIGRARGGAGERNGGHASRPSTPRRWRRR